jgi:hypothetical protein
MRLSIKSFYNSSCWFEILFMTSFLSYFPIKFWSSSHHDISSLFKWITNTIELLSTEIYIFSFTFFKFSNSKIVWPSYRLSILWIFISKSGLESSIITNSCRNRHGKHTMSLLDTILKRLIKNLSSFSLLPFVSWHF